MGIGQAAGLLMACYGCVDLWGIHGGQWTDSSTVPFGGGAGLFLAVPLAYMFAGWGIHDIVRGARMGAPDGEYLPRFQAERERMKRLFPDKVR